MTVMTDKSMDLFLPTMMLVVATVLSGCADDYEPTIICHNANCVEPASPEVDSTPESLQASLALMPEQGRPPYDGLELDTFWWGDEQRCIMAHDLDSPRDDSLLAPAALIRVSDLLSERVAAGQPITRSKDRFSLLIELKGHVEASKEAAHTVSERRDHAACALDMAAAFMDAADTGGFEVEVVLMSFAPDLLAAIVDDEAYQQLQNRSHRLRLGALQGLPRPLDIQSEPLSAYDEALGVDFISVHPHWTRPADLEAMESRGFELGLWSFNLVTEHYDAIARWQPAYVTTSQARTLSGWVSARR